MSAKTHIEWTDATWNPVTGCSKVSGGCKHCYAERDWARLSANPKTRYYGREFTDVQCHADVLDLPLRWTRPRRVFVNSMSDLFHEAVPDEFIADVFRTMAWAHQHSFLVLTKRPERMLRLLTDIEWEDSVTDNAHECRDWPWPLANVWLGVSLEDQDTANERLPLLLQTPAAVRWVSAEPLLEDVTIFSLDGPIDVPDGARSPIDWVVAGGESGPKARPMHLDWARSLRDQCAAACVPFMFKQWGEWSPTVPVVNETAHRTEQRDLGGMARIGKKRAGRLLDGIEHNGYPEPS
jgi:protein gp37